MQTFELGELLNSHLGEYKEYAHQKNVDFTIFTDFVSRISLRGKTQKIKKLLGSIIKNTIDHSKAGSINFSVRQLLRSNKEILLEFSLESDTSIHNSSKRIAYYRSLVIARSMIEELNGKSELIVSPDSSTVLKFVISCSLVNKMENSSHENKFPSLKGKKILVVDDNEMNQKTIEQFIKNHGMECSMALDGVKAIELLEQDHSYDLVLLDILMPRKDGFETALYIRKKLNSNIPIIAIPARDKTWITLMCKDAGINSILAKPFTAYDLLDRISNTLAPAMHTTSLSLMKIA